MSANKTRMEVETEKQEKNFQEMLDDVTSSLDEGGGVDVVTGLGEGAGIATVDDKVDGGKDKNGKNQEEIEEREERQEDGAEEDVKRKLLVPDPPVLLCSAYEHRCDVRL